MTNYNERLDERLDDLTSFMESIDWETISILGRLTYFGKTSPHS